MNFLLDRYRTKPIKMSQEHSIHKTITTEEGIPDCQKVFEEMIDAYKRKLLLERFKDELADAADDYWISYNYCVAQGKKREGSRRPLSVHLNVKISSSNVYGVTTGCLVFPTT